MDCWQATCFLHGPSGLVDEGRHRGMVNGRFNCWEYQGCGRQPGGHNVDGTGVCPASVESGLDGSNGGSNGGRACWVIAGTLCEGRVCGSYQEKYVQCHKCSFYHRVEVEQGLDWEGDVDLLLKYGDSLGR